MAENGSIINNFIGSLLAKGKQAHENIIPAFDISKPINHAAVFRKIEAMDHPVLETSPIQKTALEFANIT